MILLASVPAWLMGRWLARAPESSDWDAPEDDEPVRADEVSFVGGVR
jgi:hypothetical protein